MWTRISSCFRRHRRKLLIFGGVVGGFAILNNYLRRKFMEWETRRTLEYFEQMKRQSHFEGTMQTCDTALVSFTPKIREIICSTIDVNPIVDELKKKPSNKVELWDELKIMVFTQAVGEVYAQCLLVVLLRVQISILGGYIFSDFQKNKGSSEVPNVFNTTENQQKYLSHITSFFVNGIKDLMIPMEDAVRLALKDVHLKNMMMLNDFNEIFVKITQNMSQGSSEVIPNISQYLMLAECRDTNQNAGTSYDQFLGKILNETKDVLECADFNKVLLCSIQQGIAVLMDRVSECFIHLSNGHVDFMNPHNLAIPMAKIIPIMHTVFGNHEPNEQGSLVHTLLQQESLKTFAANLYESFSQGQVLA